MKITEQTPGIVRAFLDLLHDDTKDALQPLLFMAVWMVVMMAVVVFGVAANHLIDTMG